MPIGSDWELVFSDDFDVGVLDAVKWSAYDAISSDGIGTFRAANVSASDGQLHLRVDSNFDSARVTTGSISGAAPKALFGYGWFEARIRLPLQTSLQMTGAWHAFWLLGENNQIGSGDGPQEEDFEMRGSFPNQIRLGHIWQQTPTILAQGVDPVFVPYDGQWHTYAYHWQPNQIDWYIDGELRHTYSSNIPSSPLQIVFDAKVGGWGGDPDGNTTFPYTMDVDYVRVLQKVNRSSLRWYQRITYGPGTLDATNQGRFLAALKEIGARLNTSGIIPVARVVTAQDIVLRYTAPATLTAAQWANVLYRRLNLTEATVLANLTITDYSGADYEARRLACKAALSL